VLQTNRISIWFRFLFSHNKADNKFDSMKMIWNQELLKFLNAFIYWINYFKLSFIKPFWPTLLKNFNKNCAWANFSQVFIYTLHIMSVKIIFYIHENTHHFCIKLIYSLSNWTLNNSHSFLQSNFCYEKKILTQFL